MANNTAESELRNVAAPVKDVREASRPSDLLLSIQNTLEHVQAVLPRSSDPAPTRLPAAFDYERFDDVSAMVTKTI